MFRELDKDINGSISASELKSGIMTSLEEKIKQMTKEADRNGDGQINFLEFAKVNEADTPRKASFPISKTGIKSIKPEPPKPPDGGWGWVIVFASFMCNFIVGKSI